MLEASVLLKSSFAAAEATCEFTSSLLRVSLKKNIGFWTFQTNFFSQFFFQTECNFIWMNAFIFLRDMKKISKNKCRSKTVSVKHKAFFLLFFFPSPFGRRRSRITLCQPETYFLCLSSPSSKPKIINYSHSFGLLLFDCCLSLWSAFRNVPPGGKFGLCGSRCRF